MCRLSRLDNSWQVSILSSDKIAVASRDMDREPDSDTRETRSNTDKWQVQVLCQLQDQTRPAPWPLLSVSHSPGNLADFCESMEICIWVCIFHRAENQWKDSIFPDLFRLELSEWVRRIIRKMAGIKPIFPGVYFYWWIKRQLISEKQCDYIHPYVQSLKRVKVFTFLLLGGRWPIWDSHYVLWYVCLFSTRYLTLHCLIQKTTFSSCLFFFFFLLQSSSWINWEINTSQKEPEKFLIGATAVFYM